MRKGEKLLRYLINDWLDVDRGETLEVGIIGQLRNMDDDEFDQVMKEEGE